MVLKCSRSWTIKTRRLEEIWLKRPMFYGLSDIIHGLIITLKKAQLTLEQRQTICWFQTVSMKIDILTVQTTHSKFIRHCAL